MWLGRWPGPAFLRDRYLGAVGFADADRCADLQQTSLQGPQDTRLITDAPVPRPGRGEVLIRVAAAGVNFVDISRAYGTFLGGPQPPYLAGFEAAGEVVEVGEAVTGLQPGTHVIGVGDGAFAEYMVLSAAAAMPLPADWTAEQALGMVVNWPAALAALPPTHLRVHSERENAPGDASLHRTAAQRCAAAHVDDRAPGDTGAPVVGLETGADVADISALVVLVVGV